MKTIMIIALSFIVSLVFCRPSFATECRSDLDCKMYENEKCVKQGDENIGTCVKPETPQKKEAPKPASTPSSSWRRGQFCTNDKDCEPGQSCVKKENAMFGTCF